MRNAFQGRIPSRRLDQDTFMRRCSTVPYSVGQSSQEFHLGGVDRLSEPQVGQDLRWTWQGQHLSLSRG